MMVILQKKFHRLLSGLSSTFRMAATLFLSALLMPPLNEPTNLEK